MQLLGGEDAAPADHAPAADSLEARVARLEAEVRGLREALASDGAQSVSE
jgi:uncharacterized protein YceH (UPF0502 family)